MYQVLYRKWRPSVFADVVGQPQVTDTLRNELAAGRIAHAYLFTGSRGTGKTTCAKILAKAVNCLSPNHGDPCGTCDLCKEADAGSLLDIVEIDAASNNGVDHIRMLREEANFTPSRATYRVYIIDEVHMLSQGAFNALLKTLEEPPAHVIFILATTEVHKLPATILSRCQRFAFRRIPAKEIAARLQYIAGQEGASITEDAALLIAQLADGALRDALSLLDQCIGMNSAVTEAVVNQTVGIAGREHLYQFVEAISRHDTEAAFTLLDLLHQNSKDMMRLCEELCMHFRNLMLLKTMRDASSFLAVSDAEYQKLQEQALSLELPTLLHCVDTLQTTMEQMGRGANQRIGLELAFAKLCQPKLDTGPNALLRRIDALERKLNTVQLVPPVSPVQPTEISELSASQVGQAPEAPPAPALSPKAQGMKADPIPEEKIKKAASVSVETLSETAQLFPEWPEVLQVLKESSRSVAAAFSGSSAYCSGDYLLIDAEETSMAFELLRKEENRKKMRATIQQITGKEYKLGPYKRPKPEPEQDDPLELFAKKAEAAGIPVIKK